MKCLTCKEVMVKLVDNFDYSHLAGLRGVTVTLCDVTIHQCERCGPTSQFVEIPRWGDLERELKATKALRTKQRWCSFRDNEWVIVLPIQAPTAPTQRRKRSR